MSVNYLNNKDLLKQIHLSKNTFCSFINPELDHQYDVIIRNKCEIDETLVQTAQKARSIRIEKETGEHIEPNDIAICDLRIRLMTWEHIPNAPRKLSKSSVTNSLSTFLDEVNSSEYSDEEDPELDSIIAVVKPPSRMKTNFPPFFHYRITKSLTPVLVGKSHWNGDLKTGKFDKRHGQITDELGHMIIKLIDRYSSRPNWRGYTYVDEMRGQALLQLSQVVLQFDESKGANPFAYMTQIAMNSFRRVLQVEKRNQNTRDDLLIRAGLNPSFAKQGFSNHE